MHLSAEQRIAVDAFQRGIVLLQTETNPSATDLWYVLGDLQKCLEWITQETWPQLWRATTRAIKEAKDKLKVTS